ncbi:RagB/SusD family nutrient uptake outer membrane protein [Pedobacter cryotolerans]|uniref:RagB/SusD family nutrient uptake outer membrane protein n=1 Tax=Pedobacter cryotolerans TaxID=2571270 RepID=A0A4U1CBR6_9SPHI|nr:RagB/SusD family nutrient uptake outer membrane protein [Pedobacter cryotolerans]TKC03475.1 RagB/SusD family nutrient uptake outer membrane protein [Pedobacter cryotolerans]
MKNSKQLLLILGLFMLPFLGCKKYLDQKSNDSLVVPKSLTDIQGILDDAAIINLRVTPSYNEHSSDDFFMLPASYASYNPAFKPIYTWQPTVYNHGNDYALGYNAIYNTNLSLDLLKAVERNGVNAAPWDNIKGSALFIRAYYFLMLTSQFGLAYDEASSAQDLGIPLRLDTQFDKPSVRATVAACYQQVIDDLETSVGLLPDYPQHLMRPSKGAALALLARCYLYMHQYELALKYAEDALLLNNKLINYNGDPDLLALTSTVPIKKFNKETIWYAEMSGGFGANSTTRARVDTALYLSYANNDLRKTAYFRAIAPYQQFKGNYTATANIYFSGLATDELYITRAECKAFLNDVEGGMADLNLLLKTRWRNTVAYVPLVGMDRIDALNKIRSERRKELLYRGLRWEDIKRYNKEGANLILKRVIDGQTFTILPNSRNYALSLPDDVIRVSGMPQN